MSQIVCRDTPYERANTTDGTPNGSRRRISRTSSGRNAPWVRRVGIALLATHTSFSVARGRQGSPGDGQGLPGDEPGHRVPGGHQLLVDHRDPVPVGDREGAEVPAMLF